MRPLWCYNRSIFIHCLHMKTDTIIVTLLVSSPGVINYNPSNFFEVQPGRKSPLFINIKNTLSNMALRKTIVDSLIQNLSSEIDLVCGIESGGSYYASVAADRLNRPLVLFRKNNKTYAEEGRFVGTIPRDGKRAVIIDDVLMSGTTIDPAVNSLKRLGYVVDVIAIFSYGYEDFVKKRLSVKVFSIANINNLLTAALDKKILTSNDVDFLKDFISQQKKDFFITSKKTSNT